MAPLIIAACKLKPNLKPLGLGPIDIDASALHLKNICRGFHKAMCSIQARVQMGFYEWEGAGAVCPTGGLFQVHSGVANAWPL